MSDPRVLLLLWAAPIGSNPGDPAVWRAASPHWSEARRALIASKYEKALAGQDDPEFDDPDPMRGFEAQYLNIWRLAETRTVGNPVTDEDGWTSRQTPGPGEESDRGPDSIAVEAWWGGVSVARAWKPTAGPVIVHVVEFPDLPTAARTIATWRPRKPILAGASLAEHAAWRQNRLRVTKMTTPIRTSVADLVQAMTEARFVHTGDETLAGQVLALRVSPGTDGPRIRSTARGDAIKAAMWAIHEASLVRRRSTALPSRHLRPDAGT